eukprot:251294-Rhodomonas_salina.1
MEVLQRYRAPLCLRSSLTRLHTSITTNLRRYRFVLRKQNVLANFPFSTYNYLSPPSLPLPSESLSLSLSPVFPQASIEDQPGPPRASLLPSFPSSLPRSLLLLRLVLRRCGSEKLLSGSTIAYLSTVQVAA